MTDLNLSKYEGFTEKELKGILLEEKRKMYRPESVVGKFASAKIKVFWKILLKSIIGWATRMKYLHCKTF